MTHSQTQGAEGAGTSLDDRLRAAGMFTIPEMMGETPLTRWQTHAAMTSLDAFEWWLDAQVRQYLTMKAEYEIGDKPKDDELYEWVLAHSGAFHVIRTNFRAAKSSTAAPAATSDVRSLLRTARSGLATYGAGAFEGTIAQIDAILAFDPATPAPAAAPGVPDSVRAQVAATIGRVMCECGPGLATGAGCFEKAADAVLALIATQPAGQSTRQRADDRNNASGAHTKIGAALDATMEARGANRQQAFFREAAARVPAPNSTRTGAAETEKVTEADLQEFAKSKGWYVRAGTSVPQIDGGWRHPFSITADSRDLCELINTLAARPEAPSDAGWSFDMAAAPRDGTPLDLWCHGRRSIDYRWDAEGRFGGWWSDTNHKHRHWRDRECLLADQPTAWRLADTPPSDPAPSGQAEG